MKLLFVLQIREYLEMILSHNRIECRVEKSFNIYLIYLLVLNFECMSQSY